MGFFERARVAWKDDDSMLTEADLAVEDLLTREIGAAFPRTWCWARSAEAGSRSGRAPCLGHRPVDGTITSAAASRLLGVHRSAPRRAPVAASSTIPSRASSSRLPPGGRLAQWPTASHRAGRAGAALALLHPRAVCERCPPFVSRWLERYRLRRPGSTALALCYVAAGALAFVHDHRASLWDIAGAAPVLLEAGGMLTDPAGGDLFPMAPGAIGREPIAFLAGDPIGHHESLSDIHRIQ